MKRGAITMKYVISFVLAAILLVLIIYGIQIKGFGPLKENIEARYNEALIFLNIRDDKIPTCGDAFLQEIEGVGSGNFYPCEDRCGFVLTQPTELLGFDTFNVSQNVFMVSINKTGYVRSDPGYSFKPVESVRHREAFLELKKVVDEFLENVSMEYSEFVSAMDYDDGRDLVFEFNKWFGKNTDTYTFDGEKWVNEKGEEISKEEVLRILSEFKKDGQVSYDHNDLEGESIGKAEFSKWFNNLKKFWISEIKTQANRETVYIHPGTQDVYFLDLESLKWKIRYKQEVRVDDSELVDILYAIYSEGQLRAGWTYETLSWDYGAGNGAMKFLFGTSYAGQEFFKEKYRSSKETGVEEFVADFEELLLEKTKEKDKYDDVLEKLKEFLKSKGQTYSIGTFAPSVGHDFSTIYIVINGERFGLYYVNERVFLTYNNVKSPVSDFVQLSDSDWEEFLKILKIYEHFKLRRCI